MTKKNDADRAESIAWLKKNVPAGSTVYGIVRKVSGSGMSRTIDFYAFPRPKRGEPVRPLYLTGHMARVLDCRMDKHRGMRVNGCGMDMIFHCVYETASVVFRGPDGKWSEASARAWRSEQL